ncbi:uncharacterized protein LOC135375502 isoform X1 [Ornithodoros turicata]|uniref:uncharacterized protein LOC135375502 isoform X1 n=1 Tax=Ornithodoros turicata TaxID=34597 RepID=UPI003138E28B
MGGSRCCVDSCDNYSVKNSAAVFHLFPSNIDLRQRWIEVLRAVNKRSGWTPSKSTVICSDHFSDDSYITNSSNSARQSLGLGRKGCRLRPEAVPSRFRKRAADETWGSCTSAKECRLADFDLETLLPGSSIKVTSSTQTYPNCSNRGCQAMPDSRTRGTLTFPDLRNRGTQAFIESRSKGCQVFTRETQAAKDRSVGCQADIKPNVHRSTQTDFKDIPTSPQKKAGRHSSGNPSHGPPVSSEQHDTTRSSSADDGRETAPCPGTQCAIISSSAEETSPSTARESIAEEPNYVVSDTQLLEALQYCRDCGTTDCRVQLSTEGHLVRAVITCKRSHARTWHSQRFQCDK